MEARRVLIVDDSPPLRLILSRMLKVEGFEVVGALSSGQGLSNAILERAPDIVCLDYELPGHNGIEILQELQRQHPHVAVVMITGESSKALVQEASALGTSAFLSKPFSQAQIGTELRRVAEALDKLREARPLGSGVSRRAARRPGSLGKAIIADDSRTFRQLLTTILQDIGLHVVAYATNGRQAVTLCQEHTPTLVCLDVEMPELNGVSALAEIRDVSPDTMAVMISGQTNRGLVMEAIANGAQGYIVKPFDVESVKATLTALLDKHRREREP
jgi:DNA-binding NarL/FixJ family response regulator